MTVDSKNRILTIVLAIVIVILGYILYHAIVDPYEKVEQRQQMTEWVHQRMINIRDGLVRYEQERGEFPPSKGGLDSLVHFISTDSLMIAIGDSIFTSVEGRTFKLDSLIYSPRPPHKEFEYTLNDTIRPNIYLLKDPGTDDHIGSLENTTQLNAPSWL